MLMPEVEMTNSDIDPNIVRRGGKMFWKLIDTSLVFGTLKYIELDFHGKLVS